MKNSDQYDRQIKIKGYIDFLQFNHVNCSVILIVSVMLIVTGCQLNYQSPGETRQRISINKNWYFFKYDSLSVADDLIYDVRPETEQYNDDKPANSKPTEALEAEKQKEILKPWIMPTGNDFIKDPKKRYIRPKGTPGKDFPFVQSDYDDSSWELVDLPHDWAIKGPFMQGWKAEIGGGMGRLPVLGVAWYRKKLDIPVSDSAKSIFLDIDGAMSYAIVWLNGKLVGGWPYGYASWRVDLTPYVKPGKENQLAIRLDNPPVSSRWYTGAGIYRNVWLVKTHLVHVGQWGTFITTKNISEKSAIIDLEVNIENDSEVDVYVNIATNIYEMDQLGEIKGRPVLKFEPQNAGIDPRGKVTLKSSSILNNPKFWGPPPSQVPNLYVAITNIRRKNQIIDTYRTSFGIRTVTFVPDSGIFVNGEHIVINGANQHHDLGALGAAFNTNAAKRQLEILREAGCNAIRMAHNPPAPELLKLTDRMGFLVVDEIFDVWERKKTPLDFHLIFSEWHEQDMRAFIRRDRNCPSIIMWSFGNEVGEQYTGEEGANVARKLNQIVKEEDPTRPTTTAMNFAKAGMPLPGTVDLISLNYQGEGIRNARAYAHLKGISTPPVYPEFHDAYPGKVILSSENAAALSTRGEYLFPVTDQFSSPIAKGQGGDPENKYVSSYELYTADFGSSADKVFASLDKHPYVAGGFVWSGWDYLGEPTPYYLARSSYFGIVDLAGFKKDRFYLYQSYWRPDHPMAHILPHWNWPDRVGKITPIHVFTSGDEAELFLNGKSLGKKKKKQFEYRLRWDSVIYQPGELRVIAYKKEKKWAEELVKTTEEPAKMEIHTNQKEIDPKNNELAFVTVKITDKEGNFIRNAKNEIQFSIEGPGMIVASDNGDPTDFTPFVSETRKAFNGYCLVIVKGMRDKSGDIILNAHSDHLEKARISIKSIDMTKK